MFNCKNDILAPKVIIFNAFPLHLTDSKLLNSSCRQNTQMVPNLTTTFTFSLMRNSFQFPSLLKEGGDKS